MIRAARLDRSQKAIAIIGIILAMIGTAVVDYYLPTVELRPLSYIFVVAITAVGGYRWGLAGVLLASVLFTSVEHYGMYRPSSSTIFWEAFISLLALSVAVALVEVIRSRTAAAQQTEGELALARAENERLREVQAAQASTRAAEQRYRAVGESLPFGTWQTSADGSELVHISDSFLTMVGATKDDIAHGGWLERVPSADRERFYAAWENRNAAGFFEGEYRIRGADGKQYWILSRGVPLRDEHETIVGWVGFSLDVTQSRKASEQVSFLAELSRVLSLSLDPTTTLERTAHLIVPRFSDWCAVDLLTESKDVERVVLTHVDPAMAAKAKGLMPRAPRDLTAPRGAPHVIATGDPENYDRIPEDVVAVLDPGDPLDAVRHELGMCAGLIVPLSARGQTIGAMTFASCEPNHRFDADDLRFANLIARRVAIAYDNARLYARERRVADILQRSSLPEALPDIPGLTINAYYLPGAREAEIGGDWYDAFQLPDGKLALSIGDVAGKGLQAAANMSAVRLALRAAALEGLAPSQVLARTNHLLLNEKPMMVTAIFGILDTETLSFTCAIAGHPLPVFIQANGAVSSPAPISPPLGLFRESSYAEQTTRLERGAMLVLYTDGLTEFNRDIALGEADLKKAAVLALQSQNPNPAVAIATTLVGSSPLDDVAILTVRTSREPIRELDLTMAAVPSSSRLLRQALHRLYLAVGLDDETISPLQVAVGESIMNVIEHAYGVKGGPVRVRAFVEDDNVIVEVSDHGHWRKPRNDGRGRGLQIIRGLVRDAEFRRTDDGTLVRLMQPLKGRHA